MNLLCIDDAIETQFLVKRTFYNYDKVICAGSYTDGLEKFKSSVFDIVLLDLCLGDGDGNMLLKTIKESEDHEMIPVLIMSSKSQTGDKVTSFEFGADDYIVKPFDPQELKVRVDSKLKQYLQLKRHRAVEKIGNLQIDHTDQRVSVAEGDLYVPVDLTSIEYKILSFFFRYLNQVVSREQIMNWTWKYGFNISDRTVDSHICRLRKKMAAANCAIVAVHNSGYRLALKK